MEHIVIIGNGISGITTARYVRKFSDKRISVISAESKYFFSRTALMYVYMGHQKWEHLEPYEDWFWEKNRIELLQEYVEKVDTENKQLFFQNGKTMQYDKLVLATGSKPKFYGWEGQDAFGVQGLVTKQDLELLEENTKNISHAVIVGGGLIGVELAEMLRTRKIDVTFLVREEAFGSYTFPQENAKMISNHIASHKINLRFKTELQKINKDENNRVRSITTTEGEEIPCQFVGITTGVAPNISFLKNSGIETDIGILVNRFLETNIPDVFAIGDCAQQREPISDRPAVESLWYTGRMMGETLAMTLTEKKMPYKPSHWFNSAKFFDIEYQTYGRVYPKPRENETHFHWEHSDKKKAITIAFNNKTNQFLGINSFGIRMRHPVFEQWLNENREIDYVLANLRQANFDPEFYDRHQKEIFSAFKNQLAQA